MKVFTERQWQELPESRRGRVSHDTTFRYTANRFGHVVAKAVPNGPYVGRRTLVMGRRLLIEGVDFEIEESLV